MPKGQNGLPLVAQLSEKQKCRAHPTKHMYKTTAEAWIAARERTASTGIDIAPYLCASCGYSHLSKQVKNGDVLTRQEGGKVVTGAMRKRMGTSTHPVYARAAIEGEPVAEPEEEGPVVPGNQDARRKMAVKWLEGRTEIRAGEYREAFSVSPPTMRLDLESLGWKQIRRGVYAKPADAAPIVTPDSVPANVPTDDRWQSYDASALGDLTLGQITAVLWSAGKTIRVQIADRA